MMTIVAPIALLVALAPSPAPSPPSVAAAAVPIAGDLVRAGASLDAAARGRLTRRTASVTDPDGSVAVYGGVALADVLRDAGALTPGGVRGRAARAYVVVHAADRYAAIYSLAELQTSDERCAPLVADTRDGAPLGADVGPVRIVAPCDLTHARWVRGVASLGVIVVPADPGAPPETTTHR